jgi:hypothetical protein
LPLGEIRSVLGTSDTAVKLASYLLPYPHKINYAKSDSLIDRSDQSGVVGRHDALPLIFPRDMVRDTQRAHRIVIISVFVFKTNYAIAYGPAEERHVKKRGVSGYKFAGYSIEFRTSSNTNNSNTRQNSTSSS